MWTTYNEITDNIKVEVAPQFVSERSNPAMNYYFFSYQVKVSNLGETPVQLLHRHWIIRDGKGREEHVQGEGVVGEKPVIMPGESYEYTSFCPLATPTGNMRGTYLFADQEKNKFQVRIPLFFLRTNQPLH